MVRALTVLFLSLSFVVSAITPVFGSIVILSQKPADKLTFEVAAVHLYKPGGLSNSPSYSPQGITFRGVALSFAIGEAYQFPVGRIIGPSSLTKQELWLPLEQQYDIVAKAERAVSKSELRLMLQSLLADRFNLKLHWESKSTPVYRLVVAKTGLKLEESVGGGDFAMLRSADGFIFRNAEMMRLSGLLTGLLDRTVVDGTGLNGLYTFTLKMPQELQQSLAGC